MPSEYTLFPYVPSDYSTIHCTGSVCLAHAIVLTGVSSAVFQISHDGDGR
jgi:hypothetical protein